MIKKTFNTSLVGILKNVKFVLVSGFIICCSHVSYSQTASSAQQNVPNDSIPTYELEDIVITADSPMIKSDGATTTYDVSQDTSANSMSVLDLLRKVPMVSVDPQDNILLKGQSDYKIYVNGHEDPSLSQNASLILKMTPASAISKIEVITEPGANYDAEGTAGIINLVIEAAVEEKSDQQAGTISLSVSNRDVSPSALFRFKKNKVTASISAAYSHNVMPQRNNSHSVTEYIDDPSISGIEEDGSQRVNFNYLQANASVSWEPNPKNLFTFNANVNKIDAGGDINSYSGIFDKSDVCVFNSERHIDADIFNTSASAQMSYKHNFNRDGQSLILTYLFNYGRQGIGLNQLYVLPENYFNPYSEQNSLVYNRQHTAQIDFTHPFSLNHTLDVGVKGIFRRNSSDNSTKYGESPESLGPDSDITDLAQNQDILAAYTSYNGTFGHLSLVGGVRYEYTRMAIKYHIADPLYSDFSSHLNDVVPNLAMTWSFSPMHNIRLAYQMRISRPTIEQVNPYELSFETNTVRKGNPDLTSQRLNRISLTYTQFSRILGGNIGIEYNNTNNLIESYQYVKDNIIYDSYANVGTRQEIALNGFLNWNIINGMALRLNGRVGYLDFNCPQANVKRSGFTGNYNINWDYTLPNKIKLTAFGGQSFRNQNSQGYFGGFHYYGVGASRSFLKDDALTLSLRAGNFFEKHYNFNSYTNSGKTITKSHYKSDSWSVGISISWNFGKFSGQVKNTGVNVNADDAPEETQRGGAL